MNNADVQVRRITLEMYRPYALRLDIECALECVLDGRIFDDYFFARFTPVSGYASVEGPRDIAAVLTRIAEAWGIDMLLTEPMVTASLVGAEGWKSRDARWEATPLWQWLAAYFRSVRVRAILMGWQTLRATDDPGGYGPDEGV